MKNPFIIKEGVNYYLYYFPNGNRRKISTGIPTRKLAQRWADNFLNKESFIKKDLLCSELYKEFIAVNNNLKLKTLESYGTAFREFIKFAKDKPLQNYSLKDVNTFLAHKLSTASDYTAKKYRVALTTAFKYACTNKYLHINPFTDCIKVKPVRRKIRTFTKPDFNQLLSVVTEPLYYDVILFALYTGMRQGEICNIKLSQIKGNLIILENDSAFRTKEDDVRVASIADNISYIIPKYAANKEYLFEYSGRKLREDTVGHKFKKFIRKAKLNDKYNFHCLRKTYATWLLTAGVDIKTISGMLGHSSVRVTEDFYGHLLKKFQKEVNLINHLK
jgi:integrase